MSTFTTTFAVAMVTAVWASAAVAEAFSLEVSPLTVEMQMAPGDIHTGVIEIGNMGKAREHVHAYCQDWTLKPDGVVVFLGPRTLPDSASGWVDVTPAEFNLEPGERQQVRYTVHAPEDTFGEGRTAVIFEADAREVSAPGAPSRLVPRIGTILYVQCGQRPPAKARVTALELDRSGGMLSVDNLGTAHLRFTGYLDVRDSAGLLVRKCELKPFVVLQAPFNRHVANIEAALLAGLPDGRYQVTAVLDHGGQALLGARVEAKLGPESLVEIASQR